MANFYISVWIFPLFSAAAWLGMRLPRQLHGLSADIDVLGTLLVLLLWWVVEGQPHLPAQHATQTIPYISDIGATHLKPLFIAGSCVTVVCLNLSFIAERWLRHRGVLVPNQKLSEKVLSVLGIVFAFAGGAGLILLSIFDTLRHPRLHDGFLLMFIAGYVISAIFTCAEYQRLGIHVRQHRILRASFWIKLAFIIVEVALAIAFGALTFTDRRQEAAVFEWVIALIFTFWVLSFFVDLLPAYRDMRYGGGAGVPQLEVGSDGAHIEPDTIQKEERSSGSV